ncbi:MAG: glycosyltransferase family 2 protein [Verrucomicrobiota bacterium]
MNPDPRSTPAAAREPLDLTIVMPCLNEAETIAACIKKGLRSLAELGLRGEVVIADNGSTDGSIEIAEFLGARVVRIPRKGYGNALRGGIEAARGRWVIMGDSDDSYDFSALGPFVEKLRQGFELVMGCRMPYGGGTILPGAMPWKHRWIGNPALSFIGRLFFKCPVTDFHCGLRGFERDAFQRLQLKTTGMEFASEMVIKATLLKLKIAEVPITLHKDGRSRPPHLRSWRDGWRHLRFMLLFSPRWLFLWPGLLLLAVGLLLFVPLSVAPVQVGRVQFNTNTLLVAGMMVVVGFQVLFFGVFTKLYGVARGLMPESRNLNAVVQFFSLERGIAAGILILLVGVAFLAAAVWKWKAAGFGRLDYAESLRLVIPAVTCLTLSVQTIFSSFFLSILELKHD